MPINLVICITLAQAQLFLMLYIISADLPFYYKQRVEFVQQTRLRSVRLCQALGSNNLAEIIKWL